MSLTFQVRGTSFCCGLDEIGALGVWPLADGTLLPDAACFATTVPSQFAEVIALKARGFKKVARFKGRTGREITLWLHIPRNKEVEVLSQHESVVPRVTFFGRLAAAWKAFINSKQETSTCVTSTSTSPRSHPAAD